MSNSRSSTDIAVFFGNKQHSDTEWRLPTEEGQLSVDVSESDRELAVVSPMAGVLVSSIEVSVHNDLLTIRGIRPCPESLAGYRPIHAECFWGSFSRTIVLPSAVNAGKAKAHLDRGVMIIRIPKRVDHARVPIVVVEE